jgi:hypothetical protein
VDVSAPYQAVVPTLDGAVLTTLARLNGPVTGRQVHHLAGVGSEAGIRKVLNRLVVQGVVRASQAGSAWLYEVNREHVAWPAVTALAGMRGEFLSRLRFRFGEWSIRARSAALFGSAAREDGGPDSDIDLLLIRQDRTDPDDPTWAEQIAQLRADIAAWTGNHAQVYELDGDGLIRHIAAGQRIVDEWRRDAITLAGTDLHNLLRELGHRSTARSSR